MGWSWPEPRRETIYTTEGGAGEVAQGLNIPDNHEKVVDVKYSIVYADADELYFCCDFIITSPGSSHVGS